MTSLAEKLARPEILALEPYQTAYHEGTRHSMSIKLDANENPYRPLMSDRAAADINRYPEPQPAALRNRLADIYGVPAAQIMLGRGADEAIDLLVRAFCRAGDDAVLICPPPSSYYPPAAHVQGARVLEAPLADDFQLAVDDVIRRGQNDPSLKIVFLCSPMNPTGNSIDTEEIRKICRALPETLIVVDEAYIEFSDRPSLSPDVAQFDNLVVLRTLSKAYGLAGARCGVAIAPEGVIAVLSRIMAPYPLSSLTLHTVMEALSPVRMQLVQRRVAEIREQRARLLKELPQAESVKRVWPSDANAILLQAEDGDQFASVMASSGIQVRRREMAAPGGFRITVGSPAENDILLAALGLPVPQSRQRVAEKVRTTSETAVSCWINLDREGASEIATGVGFFDHMVEQVARHGGFSVRLRCDGDLEIDPHHTIEDCMLTFGDCLFEALGDKRGIGRFGFLLPMDETEAQVSLDLGGRPFCKFSGSFSGSHIGQYPTEMTAHAFRSLADRLGAAIHVSVEGDNDHHKTEACFKAFGRALRMALRRDGDEIPSTKGVL